MKHDEHMYSFGSWWIMKVKKTGSLHTNEKHDLPTVNQGL